jgi:hypothetical protein
VPVRPSWACHACGSPWPCLPARLAEKTTATTDPTATAVYLGMRWLTACEDLDIPADMLWLRFAGWLREPEHDGRKAES